MSAQLFNNKPLSRGWFLLLSLPAFLWLAGGAGSPAATAQKPPPAPAVEEASPYVLLSPGLDDAPIARLTARMLQQGHYLRQPFNDVVSSNFLTRLLNNLDPAHLHFVQSDLDEFERYRFALDDLTLRSGNTLPAYGIFNRFVRRLEQRVDFVNELLGREKFRFNSHERIALNRRDQPFPQSIDEAKQLWRERLRFEYLQEKLGLLAAPAKPHSPTAAKPNPPGTDKSVAAKPLTPEQIHEEIVKTLTRRYARILRSFKEWDSADVLQFYLTTLAHVYDPYSDYFGKAQLEDFSISMNLALFGIGALLTSEDGYCLIKELKPGPALKSGKIKPNDRIVAVAQGDGEPVDVVDMPLKKVVNLIRGPKGTTVRLTLIPAHATDPAARKSVSLVRDEIKLEDQEAKARIIELPGGEGSPLRLGVIDLPSFYASFDATSSQEKSAPRSTTADVAKLIRKLEAENVNGLILDLRRNGGGSLEEAIKLTGLFIKRGPVVQVRDPAGTVVVQDDDDPSVLYDGPLVVLTRRFSASASEIVAGALQDYGRALIVGDISTHGKGTVQSLTQLRPYLRIGSTTTNDPGALKFTIRKFYRPSGSSTQLKGVVPDIVLPSINNVGENIGEAAQENALPWDTITGADFERLNLVTPYLEELRKRSARRVVVEKDFAYVREDMELVKKAQADKTVSLNEAERLKEKAETEARKKAREQELAARKPSGEKVYDLTLKLADQPGLPPPTLPTNSVIAKAPTTGRPDAAPAINSVAKPADDDEVEEAKLPQVDVDLKEAGRIMVDYLSLLPRDAMAVVAH